MHAFVWLDIQLVTMKKALVLLLLIIGSISTPAYMYKYPLKVDLEYSEHALGLNFVIHADKEHPVKIRIKDKDRELVFERSFYGAKIYKGTFNLSRLSSGRYYVEIRHYQHKVVKELKISKTALRTVSLNQR